VETHAAVHRQSRPADAVSARTEQAAAAPRNAASGDHASARTQHAPVAPAPMQHAAAAPEHAPPVAQQASAPARHMIRPTHSAHVEQAAASPPATAPAAPSAQAAAAPAAPAVASPAPMALAASQQPAPPAASPTVGVRYYSVMRDYGMAPDPVETPTDRPMVLIGPPDPPPASQGDDGDGADHPPADQHPAQDVY
jgi:hypothetical protein